MCVCVRVCVQVIKQPCSNNIYVHASVCVGVHVCACVCVVLVIKYN